jgi:hypothetical protein
LLIAMKDSFFGANWDGLIDEVRIYNRALSAGEVTRLYNLTRPKFKVASSLGLVGYWALDEGQGTIAGDMSGHGNSGSLIGGSSWVTGKRGKAVEFSATSKYIQIANNPILQIPSQITLAAWVRRTTGIDSWKHVLCKTDATSSEYWLGYNSSNWPSIMINPGDADDSDRYYHYGVSTAVVDSNWHHLVGTHDGTYVRMYLDGVLISTPESRPGAFYTGTGTLGIGRCIDKFGTYQSAGDIDEVRVYNRALSDSEVANLYSSSKKIFKVSASQNNKLTDGLVGMWSFNGPDIAGVTAYDRSGQNHNGTITGATIAIGKVGQALKFDGSSYINAGNGDSLNITGDKITLSAWVNYASTPADSMGAFGHLSSSGGYRMFVQPGDIASFQIMDGGSNPYVSSAVTLSRNDWHHLAGVYNGAKLSIYVDGEKDVNETNMTGNIPSDPTPELWIGTGDDIYPFGQYTYPFTGKIDEVRVYSRALSAAEIKRLYEMGK